MITAEQEKALKNRLLEMKEENEEKIEAEETGNANNNTETIGELSEYSNHPGDQGTELHEMEKDAALNNQAREQLENIDHALEAMENGNYGKCEVCGREIPYERLEIVPETTRCVDHAGSDAPAQDHPVEEDVVNPGPEREKTEENVAFDKEDTWEAVSEHSTSETPSDDPDMTGYTSEQEEEEEQEGRVEKVEDASVADMEGEDTGNTADQKEQWQGSRNSAEQSKNESNNSKDKK